MLSVHAPPVQVLHRHHSPRLTICCTHQWQSDWLLGTTHKCQTCVLPKWTSQLHILLLKIQRNGTTVHSHPPAQGKPFGAAPTDGASLPTAVPQMTGACNAQLLACHLQLRAHHLLLHPQVASLHQLLRLCQRHEAPLAQGVKPDIRDDCLGAVPVQSTLHQQDGVQGSVLLCLLVRLIAGHCRRQTVGSEGIAGPGCMVGGKGTPGRRWLQM